MILLISLVLIVSLLLFLLQTTFFLKKWVRTSYLIAISIGVFLVYPMSINESYITMQQSVDNRSKVIDFVTLVILEGIFGCLFSISQVKLMFGETLKKYWSYALYFCGIIFIISIYYIEVLLFINIRYFDFQVFAVILSLFIPVLLWFMMRFLKYLIPEQDLRIEMKFILHLTQILLAIILSILSLKQPVDTMQNMYLKEFSTTLIIAFLFAIVGYFYQKQKIKKQWKL